MTGKKRRGPGEGTIRKRSNGRWEVIVRMPASNGGTVKDSRSAATYREALRLKTTMAKRRAAGLSADSGRLTVAQYLDHWHETTVKATCRPATALNYRKWIDLHLVPAIGRVRLDDLAPRHVEQFMADMVARGLSPRSADHARGVLRSALGRGVSQGLLDRNAAALAHRPYQIRYQARTFTPDQARRFLTAVREDRLEAMYRVALSLGLRKGEALRLQWTDVEIDDLNDGWGMLQVAHQLQRINKATDSVPVKTDSSRRRLPLPPILIEVLRRHRQRVNEERLAARVPNG